MVDSTIAATYQNTLFLRLLNLFATPDIVVPALRLIRCSVLPAVVMTRLLSTLTLLGLIILLVSPIPAILSSLDIAILIVLLFVVVANLPALSLPRRLLTRCRTPRVRPTRPVTPFGTLLFGNFLCPVTLNFLSPPLHPPLASRL